MVKKTDKLSLYFDIHSIIGIKASNINEEVKNFIINRFGVFMKDRDINDSDSKADIVLSPLETDKNIILQTYNKTKNTKSYWIIKHDNNLFIVFGYRGRTDIVISLSDPIQVLYTRRRGFLGKLFNCLIFSIHLALYVKEGLLFHGSVICSGDTSLLLTGPSSTGKSILTLNMLHEGWNYLSDDVFIFYNGIAHNFRNYIPLRDYHYQILPWLNTMNFSYKRGKILIWFRNKFRIFAENHLPNYLLPRLEKVYNPSFRVIPEEISPDIKIINTSIPTVVIVLVPGNEFHFTDINKSEAVSDMETIQELDFPDFKDLGRLLSLYGYGDRFDIVKILGNQFDNQKYYKLVVPYNTNSQWLYQNFKKCLKSVL